MSKSKSSTVDDNQFVDLSKFELERREVSVNGKMLPLAIGDKILVNEDDHIAKTIMTIQVHEDGRVSYMLEWFDSASSDFKTEWLTASELRILNSARKGRKVVKAFSQED